MWYYVGIKDTCWGNYIELDSEDKTKLAAEFFKGAYQYLNLERVIRMEVAWVIHGVFPPDMMYKQVEKPQQKWLKQMIKMLEKDIEEDTNLYNKLSDLLEPEVNNV